MTDSERLARETFYQNLIWIVDGRGFRKNFYIYHLLPHPESELARDIRWFKTTRQMRGAPRGAFWRPSENLGHKTGDLVLYHDASEIEAAISNAYRGHHQYDWIKPRRTWLDATCPVYVDLGDDLLAKLEIYDESGLPCIRLVAKQKLIHDAMTETAATAIATRFYPLPPSGPPRG